MEHLWDLARHDGQIDSATLAPELLECVRLGDGVADHYGGRTAFTFLAQRDNRILALESLDDGTIQSRSVINLTGGYGTGILGSEVKVLGANLASYLHDAVTTNDEFHSPDRHRLVAMVKRLIAEHTGSTADEWEITFTSTGSEAMDLALQLIYLDGFNLATGNDARKEQDVIVACHGAWHGWSLGTNQMLDRRQFTEGLPRVSGVETVFMEYGNLNSLRDVFAQYAGRIRAVSVEGILGDGGVIPASGEWWAELFKLAAAGNTRIIDDEILTGFRCGGLLAIPEGLKPDCITLGKALGFGLFPMSAVAWRKETLALRAGIGVRTFNARPFQAAVVHAGIAMIESRALFAQSVTLGQHLIAAVRAIAADYPDIFKDVRGQGLFIGIELSNNFGRRGHFVRNALLRAGVLTEIESGIFNRKVPKEGRVNETIRLTPPLTIDAATLDAAVERMRHCAAQLRTGLQAGA